MSENSDDNGIELQKVEIQFKKVRKQRKIRKHSSTDEDGEEPFEDINSKLLELKEKQKFRNRPHGVSIIGLALGKKLGDEEELSNKDPFNLKSGGMMNMQSLKSGKLSQADDAYDTGIGTQFSAETNKRDEDEEMMKYIENQLNERKTGGKRADDEKEMINNQMKYLSPEEAALQSLPDHLRNSSTQKSEEMLSNQMLNGIPEIDLGIEAKIKNIEATEEAKQRLVQEQKTKKDGPSQFVPTNIAVNFVQHNRFNLEENEVKKRKHKTDTEKEKGGVKKATDDYHYDKFRKQFRRY